MAFLVPCCGIYFTTTHLNEVMGAPENRCKDAVDHEYTSGMLSFVGFAMTTTPAIVGIAIGQAVMDAGACLLFGTSLYNACRYTELHDAAYANSKTRGCEVAILCLNTLCCMPFVIYDTHDKAYHMSRAP